MKLGVVFPQTEIGSDPGAVREYAQAAESMGYNHILAFDHVLGANAESRPGWSGAYRHTDAFHEPFVLFGYLAAVTSSVELVTGVIILPQRQTALVAKQTAAVDVLSQGRLRLGIGVGWNAVEYEALGENFHDRGRRSEEQIDLLRKLWTNDLITYEGRWHKVTDAGLNPLPVQQPIPVWFGGAAPQTIRRVATIGDGWFPLFRPDDQGRELIESMREQADAAGRGPDDIGVESWVSIRDSSEDEAGGVARAGRDSPVGEHDERGTRLSAAHIEAIERFREVMEG